MGCTDEDKEVFVDMTTGPTNGGCDNRIARDRSALAWRAIAVGLLILEVWLIRRSGRGAPPNRVTGTADVLAKLWDSGRITEMSRGSTDRCCPLGVCLMALRSAGRLW